jgi:hypothetical protein
MRMPLRAIAPRSNEFEERSSLSYRKNGTAAKLRGRAAWLYAADAVIPIDGDASAFANFVL